jgi:hypothetical protein
LVDEVSVVPLVTQHLAQGLAQRVYVCAL